MADSKNNKLEREYTIPLRRFWLNVPQYERTGKAVKAIKIFIAKHMKVIDRDVKNVKLDMHFNNELWFRGRASPPSKVKVKATKEGEIVHVTFVETPQHIKFHKDKSERKHKVAEVKKDEKKEESKESKTEEQKKDEVEKEKSTEEQNIKQAEQDAKVQKHVTKPQKAQHPQRMALQK